MKTFLVWQDQRPVRSTQSIERIGQALCRVFAPLFVTLPEPVLRHLPGANLALIEPTVRGWTAVGSEEDDETCAIALEYPVDGRAFLRDRGEAQHANGPLSALCRRLERTPERTLSELSPPFALLWHSKKSGRTFLQNDALGHAQLFEYQDDRIWAVTNRLFALKALGIELEPDVEQWAVRSALGWFPLDMSGYRRVRFVPPGTCFCMTDDGISRTRHDALRKWVEPRALGRHDCLELARVSLIDLLRECSGSWQEPTVGLSGGMDSRAVVSSLRKLGADFSLFVNGPPDRQDVVIARELASRAGLDLEIRSSSGLPPDDPVSCKQSVQRALLWQAGHAVTHNLKSFLTRKKRFFPGRVKVIGSHAEIGKGYYAAATGATESRPEEHAELLHRHLTRKLPYLRKELRPVVLDAVLEAFHAADRYGLEGLARLSFFYLHERGRRWVCGARNSRAGFTISPFLNPGYVRACFSYPAEELKACPFHRHIVGVNSPDWIDVPFARDLEARDGDASAAVDRKRSHGNEKSDQALFWDRVGRPIVDEALAEGGLWQEVFDPDLTAELWRAAPDELVMMHLLPGVLRGEPVQRK